ncbi:MAG: aminoglycoside phosphotransferase family protein [Chloroflexota bacterium]|nr:aminoglycoside phosphotransferase family protein [Chloroflexota bacterium]
MSADETQVMIAPGIALPPVILQRFYNVHGRETTERWMESVIERLDAWCRTWQIELEQIEPPDTFNIVLFGRSRKVGDVVLKVSPPTFESRAELDAVRQAAGPGFVRLIAADPSISLIMLERIRPGFTLRDAGLSDEQATRIGAAKMREFWREPQAVDDLIPLERWARELLTHDPALHPQVPADLLAIGKDIAHDLLSSPTNRSMLHGDLHHQNILLDEHDRWITIDPKGLIGERGYDIATWMMNPWGILLQDDYVEIGNRRLDIFAEVLGEDRDRLAKWAVFHAALSLCWSLEAERPEDPEGDIAFLRSMVKLLG